MALMPSPVEACAVCGLGSAQDNGLAYFAMTVVLSALPLVMIGAVGLWIYRRAAIQDPAPPAE